MLAVRQLRQHRTGAQMPARPGQRCVAVGVAGLAVGAVREQILDGRRIRIGGRAVERRLAAGVSDELMQQVIESRDAAIQTGLVRSPQLTRKQAELLAARGANPTIRQNAQTWVQDKKAWK